MGSSVLLVLARICLLIRIFHEYLEELEECTSSKSLLILSRKKEGGMEDFIELPYTYLSVSNNQLY